MLDIKTLAKTAVDELVRIFSKEYLRANFADTCRAYGMVDESTYMYFIGIKDSDDLPDRPATDKGWVVYGKILVDAISGNIKGKEYVLE